MSMGASRPPTTSELMNDPVVQQAMEQAGLDSQPDDPAHRHEEGGWIYLDLTTGQITVQRAAPGLRSRLSLANPPLVAGSAVVGTFHTHPNPTTAGWNPGPSRTDQASAAW